MLYPAAAAATAAGLGWTWAVEKAKSRTAVRWALAALGSGAAAYSAVINFPGMKKNDPFLKAYSYALINPMAFEGVYVAGEPETNFPFWFERYVMARRPDIEFYNYSDMSKTSQELYDVLEVNRRTRAVYGDYELVLSLSRGRWAAAGTPAGFIMRVATPEAAVSLASKTAPFDAAALALSRDLLDRKPTTRYGETAGQHEALKCLANHGLFFLYQPSVPASDAYYREASLRAPDVFETHLSYANFLLITGDYDAAYDAARRAVRTAPGEPGPYLYAARARYGRGDIPGAIAWAERAAVYGPSDWTVFTFLGDYYLAADRTNDATAALRRAVRLGAGEPGPYLALARLYRQQGKDKEAVKVLTRAAKRFEDPAILAAYEAARAAAGM
jgi:tetratricopeptide (TPR) repeat protein